MAKRCETRKVAYTCRYTYRIKTLVVKKVWQKLTIKNLAVNTFANGYSTLIYAFLKAIELQLQRIYALSDQTINC